MLHERARRARWGAKIDDNYGGGDDNYPRVGVATGRRDEGLHERARRARWGAKIDDNYGGGDDNYPRVGWRRGRRDERKDVAGTGRNSCR
jgi:hypothetical protein